MSSSQESLTISVVVNPPQCPDSNENTEVNAEVADDLITEVKTEVSCDLS